MIVIVIILIIIIVIIKEYNTQIKPIKIYVIVRSVMTSFVKFLTINVIFH